MPNPINLTGHKYGWLTVLGYFDTHKNKRRWNCQCECGKELIVLGESLRSGNSTSCGCKRTASLVSRNKKSATKDGLTKSPAGRSWGAMLRRCYAVNSLEYSNYGAVGVNVCEFLRATPLNVVLLIGQRPPGMSIDRIDTNDGYHCGACAECQFKGWKPNVRWATDKQQGRNKNNNRIVELNGERRCLAEWIEVLGISKHAVSHRLYQLGWSEQDALTVPVQRHIRRQ